MRRQWQGRADRQILELLKSRQPPQPIGGEDDGVFLLLIDGESESFGHLADRFQVRVRQRTAET